MLIAGDLGSLLGTLVAGVGVDDLVIGTHQVGCLVQVMDVRGRRGERVDVSGAGIDTDVGLHSEVPLVALLRLMHLRVTGTSRVLCRGRCRDDRGVHDGPSPHDPALLVEDVVLRLKQPLAQLVLLQQMTKVQQRGRVGDLLHREVQPHEPAHRIRVIDRLLHALIRE